MDNRSVGKLPRKERFVDAWFHHPTGSVVTIKVAKIRHLYKQHWKQPNNPARMVKRRKSPCLSSISKQCAATVTPSLHQQNLMLLLQLQRAPPRTLVLQKASDADVDMGDATIPEEGPAKQTDVHSAADLPPPSSHIPLAASTLRLSCFQCRLKHHPACVDLTDPVLIQKVLTYKWHCSNCKTCSICMEAGDEAKLLFCDKCDRGYHMYCLNPPLENLPEGEWLCSEWAVCQSCNRRPKQHTPGAQAPAPGPSTRRSEIPRKSKSPMHDGMDVEESFESASAPAGTTSEYGYHFPIVPRSADGLDTYLCTYCDSCYASFLSDRYCPLCMHVYAEDSEDLAMVCCDACDRWVHVGCDPTLTDGQYQELVEQTDSKYTCILCHPEHVALLLEQRNAKREMRNRGVVSEKPGGASVGGSGGKKSGAGNDEDDEMDVDVVAEGGGAGGDVVGVGDEEEWTIQGPVYRAVTYLGAKLIAPPVMIRNEHP
ncbi:hypothetical protein BJ742DRAFT_279344 [Cladochytrium replicatum]|nr:hypothetical protein BJ742DRAFT_279344 [Cladochytrium replicatum]